MLVLQTIFPIISAHYLGGGGSQVNNYNQTSQTKNYKSSFNKQQGAIKTSGSKYLIPVSLTTVWRPGRCWKTRWCRDEPFCQGELQEENCYNAIISYIYFIILILFLLIYYLDPEMTLPAIFKLTCFQASQRISGSARRNYTR